MATPLTLSYSQQQNDNVKVLVVTMMKNITLIKAWEIRGVLWESKHFNIDVWFERGKRNRESGQSYYLDFRGNVIVTKR